MISPVPSVVQQVQLQVARTPDQLLYAFLDIKGDITQSVTYAQFFQRTTDIALHLQQVASSAPGDRVLLAYPPGIEMIAAMFACFRLGLIPVPVYPPTGHGFLSAMHRMDFIARDCGAQMVLTDRSIFWSVKWNQAKSRITQFSAKKSGFTPLKWVVSTDAVKGAPGQLESAHSDLLFLQYTSGSTSEPKGVMVTHDNILANCEAVVNHDPIGVSWLPQYHDMGLIGYYLFFALKGGTTYGATDEVGFFAVENKLTIHDVYATVLHLLGLDHTSLTYPFSGRDFRLTDVEGDVVRKIIS